MYCSTLEYSIVQYSIVQYSTVQYSKVQYSTVQYSTVQYSTVQYSSVEKGKGKEIRIGVKLILLRSQLNNISRKIFDGSRLIYVVLTASILKQETVILTSSCDMNNNIRL